MQVLHRLRYFSKLSGLKINVDKSKLLLKGDLSPADYRDTQLLIVSKLKYLGVWIGQITTEQAFAECLAIAPKRAQFLRKILAHANCTLFFTSRAAFVCKKKTRSFRVFPPEN